MDIWAEVLKQDANEIGIKDDFAERGGDSILAMQVVSKLRSQLNINFPLKVFFDVSTIADTAQVIKAFKHQDNVADNSGEVAEAEYEEGAL